MSPARASVGTESGATISGALFFKLLWDALTDLLGTAASAAIIGRASRRAQRRSPELVELTFPRIDREFGYELPASFLHSVGPSAGLRSLLEELRPLLVELTGPVALRRLEQVPQLRAWAAAPP